MFTVGEILSKTRQKRGITLEQVEKDIRLRRMFLEAIENNDWSIFSSKIYITGVIRNYSKYLGLDHKKMLAFFRRDYERREEMQFKKRIETKALKPRTRILFISAMAAIFLFFSLYFGYQLRQFLTPPPLVIVSPTQTTFRSVDRVQIIGKTDPDATVLVFDDIVIQNKDGTFTYDLPVKKGRNDFVVTVRGANGKETTVKKSYVLE